MPNKCRVYIHIYDLATNTYVKTLDRSLHSNDTDKWWIKTIVWAAKNGKGLQIVNVSDDYDAILRARL